MVTWHFPLPKNDEVHEVISRAYFCHPSCTIFHIAESEINAGAGGRCDPNGIVDSLLETISVRCFKKPLVHWRGLQHVHVKITADYGAIAIGVQSREDLLHVVDEWRNW
jgi:hypothetical protein